jgi:hypothetical protein
MHEGCREVLGLDIALQSVVGCSLFNGDSGQKHGNSHPG